MKIEVKRKTQTKETPELKVGIVKPPQEEEVPKIPEMAPLPPQPMPVKKKLFGKKVDTTFVPAIVVKASGIYLDRKIRAEDLPPDARLWRFRNDFVYSLIEYEGKWKEIKTKQYDIFEPTGECEQLPERLWRAVRALPIKKVFTYHDKAMEKLNMGLGIAFVIVCIVTLYIVANVIIGKGGS